MSQKLASIRNVQKALKLEAEGIYAVAESEAGAELSTAQEQRLAAIKGELAKLDGELDAEIAAQQSTAGPPASADPNAVAQAEANERKRSSDIIAACKMAGKIDKAAGFIAEGKSLSEVVAVLQNERASASDKNQTHSGHSGRQNGVDHKAGWDKAVDRINKRNGFKSG